MPKVKLFKFNKMKEAQGQEAHYNLFEFEASEYLKINDHNHTINQLHSS